MNKLLNISYKLSVEWILAILRWLNGFNKDFPITHPDWSKKGIHYWYIKTIKPLFHIDVQYKYIVQSNILIDVVIPVIEKDSNILGYVIDSIRHHIKHPISKIYIIAPANSQLLKRIAASKECIFIPEEDICPIQKEEIKYFFNGINRSGWLFQQLIKLSVDKISTNKYVLVCDADTIFVKDKVFIYKNQVILDQSDECHTPYYTTYKKILMEDISSQHSFICHNMLLNTKWLERMKIDIELLHQKNWWEVILDKTDTNNISGFSEYETYGNYIYKRYKKDIITEYWWNLSVSRYTATFGNYYKTMSIHSYNKIPN